MVLRFVERLSNLTDNKSPSRYYSITVAIVQIVTTLLTAGVIIGYSQLYPILLDENVYSEKCPENTTNCNAQDLALDKMFDYGASLATFIQGPSGFVLDILGPKLTSFIGIFVMVPGSLLFAYSSPTFNGYFSSFQLLSIGGPFVFVSSMPIAHSFPKSKSFVLMVLNGCYGGGALVFLIFNELHFHSGASLKLLFLIYAATGGLVFVLAILFWPWNTFIADDPIESSENLSLNTDETSEQTSALESTKIWIKSLIKDALTLDYIFLMSSTAVMILKTNFYLSTVPQQLTDIALYENNFNASYNISNNPNLSDKINDYNNVFGILLPVVGILVGPTGLLLDKFGMKFGVYLLYGLSTLSSIIGMIPNLDAQIVNFVIFSAYFPLVYTIWNSFLTHQYDQNRFGALLGTIAIVCGFVNLLNTPITNLGLEHGFLWINVGFLIVSDIFILYPLIFQFQNHKTRAKDTLVLDPY